MPCINFNRHARSMDGENRPLVTDEAVEFNET